MLAGGDRRFIGRSNEVVRKVLHAPQLLPSPGPPFASGVEVRENERPTQPEALCSLRVPQSAERSPFVGKWEGRMNGQPGMAVAIGSFGGKDSAIVHKEQESPQAGLRLIRRTES